MTKHDFRKLIEGFCTLSGLDRPERVVAGGSILVKDVMFSILYEERVNSELVFIQCHFGTLPRGREIEAYKVLMESNLSLYTGTGPTFAMEPKTGEAIFMDNYLLDQCSPEKLNGILERLAGKATEWRTNYFLSLPQQDHSKQSTASRLAGLKMLMEKPI